MDEKEYLAVNNITFVRRCQISALDLIIVGKSGPLTIMHTIEPDNRFELQRASNLHTCI